MTIKCECGHEDDWEAFDTDTKGVWKCPSCGSVKDTRGIYQEENFLAIMRERAEMRE